jgi:hypothetical protein
MNTTLDILQKANTWSDHTKKDVLFNAIRSKNMELVEGIAPFLSAQLANQVVYSAIQSGEREVVRLLSPFAILKNDNSQALLLAVQKKDMELVKFFLPHSNPRVNHSQCLSVAVQMEAWEISKELIPLSDCAKVADVLIGRQKWKLLDQFLLLTSNRCLRRALLSAGAKKSHLPQACAKWDGIVLAGNLKEFSQDAPPTRRKM